MGNFVLPVKSGASYITVRTGGNESALPRDGIRVTPAAAGRLAVLQSPNAVSVLRTAAGAHHWRLQWLEIRANLGGYSDLLKLGDGSSAQNTLGAVPYELVVDRCYIHGDPTVGQKRGISLQSASTTIINSYIADIMAVGQDSQAIAGWNGPGPYRIENNYLEAAGENVMFGGADPSIANLTPSDIVVRRNHLAKPVSWRGTAWTVKNLFELKHARRVTVEYNVFERNWLAAQAGFAILFKSTTQGDRAPWTVTEDVTFRYNVVRDVAAGLSIQGLDSVHPAQITRRITVAHNVWVIDHTVWGGNGTFAQTVGGPQEIELDHNTVIHSGGLLLIAGGPPVYGFQFTNNLARHNTYGVKGSSIATGTASLNQFYPEAAFRRNVLAGGDAADYPPDNFFPAATAFPAQFMDFTDGDYRLAPSSSYNNAGTDGTDIGADVAVIAAGTPPSEPPPGTTAAQEIVIYASDITPVYGTWSKKADATAAAGIKLQTPDLGVTIDPALVFPTTYFDKTFDALAGTRYRLWLRLRAKSSHKNNDSVWVQFSDSVNGGGAPIYRIGTTAGLSVNMATCFDCIPAGWGWHNKTWWMPDTGEIWFAASGKHTIRIQVRDDGVEIDQIVLSPARYLTAAPGPGTNDSTIVPKPASATSQMVPADSLTQPARVRLASVTPVTAFDAGIAAVRFDAARLAGSERPVLLRVDGTAVNDVTIGVDLVTGTVYGTGDPGQLRLAFDSRPPTQFLAEGARSAFFDESIDIVNPEDRDADVSITYLQPFAPPKTERRTLAPRSHATIDVGRDAAGLSDDAVSTIITPVNDVEIAAARTLTWGNARPKRGAASAATATVPSTRWYFAEGATHAGFDLYVLIANPHDRDADIRASFFREDGATIQRVYPVPARSRVTIHVDEIAGLEATGVSTILESTNGVGVYAERSTYWSTGTSFWRGGHASEGVPRPEPRWHFAEGATGNFFDSFLLLMNPSSATVTVRITFFRSEGTPHVVDELLPPASRTTKWLNQIGPLADTSFSMLVESLDGAGIVAERSMYWGGAAPDWSDGHSSGGASATATRWLLPGGEVGDDGAETYVLIANPGERDARVRATFLRDAGRPALSYEFLVPGRSRLNIPLTPGGTSPVPEIVSERFGTLLESDEPIVVEGSVYWNADGVAWEAGTNVTATPLP
jgi:hypothetical protein